MGKYQAHRDFTICVSFTRFQPDGFQFPILPVNFLFVLVIALKTVQTSTDPPSRPVSLHINNLQVFSPRTWLFLCPCQLWRWQGRRHRAHWVLSSRRLTAISEAEITALRFILSRGKSAGGLVLHQKNSSRTTWWISSSYHPSQHNQQNSVAATGGSQNMNHLLGRQSRASVSVRTAVSINHWIF